MSTRLYFVVGMDNDDLDLMVEATTVTEAVRLWKLWLAIELDYQADYIDTKWPAKVYQVGPPTGTPCVFRWNTDAMKLVMG